MRTDDHELPRQQTAKQMAPAAERSGKLDMPSTVPTSFPLAESPRMAAQRQLIQSLFGAAAVQPKAVLQRGKKGDKKKKSNNNRRRLLTRIIRQDQLKRRSIGTSSVRTSERSLKRNLQVLRATGKGTTVGSRIFSYMRKFGGAGIQGFHRESSETTRAKVVRGILRKMNNDERRVTRSSRGKKFVIVVTHADLLGRDRVYDLKRSSVSREVLSGNRINFTGMYANHKMEGVVAVDGDVDITQVLAMRAFRGVPAEDALDALIEQLLDEAEAKLQEYLNSLESSVDEEPSSSLNEKKFDRDDEDGGSEGPMSPEGIAV